MNVNLAIGPLVSLIAGILILVMPRLLNYIVALYLILIGLLGIFGGAWHLDTRHISNQGTVQTWQRMSPAITSTASDGGVFASGAPSNTM
jgi:hypothetical protein